MPVKQEQEHGTIDNTDYENALRLQGIFENFFASVKNAKDDRELAKIRVNTPRMVDIYTTAKHYASLFKKDRHWDFAEYLPEEYIQRKINERRAIPGHENDDAQAIRQSINDELYFINEAVSLFKRSSTPGTITDNVFENMRAMARQDLVIELDQNYKELEAADNQTDERQKEIRLQINSTRQKMEDVARSEYWETTLKRAASHMLASLDNFIRTELEPAKKLLSRAEINANIMTLKDWRRHDLDKKIKFTDDDAKFLKGLNNMSNLVFLITYMVKNKDTEANIFRGLAEGFGIGTKRETLDQRADRVRRIVSPNGALMQTGLITGPHGDDFEFKYRLTPLAISLLNNTELDIPEYLNQLIGERLVHKPGDPTIEQFDNYLPPGEAMKTITVATEENHGIIMLIGEHGAGKDSLAKLIEPHSRKIRAAEGQGHKNRLLPGKMVINPMKADYDMLYPQTLYPHLDNRDSRVVHHLQTVVKRIESMGIEEYVALLLDEADDTYDFTGARKGSYKEALTSLHQNSRVLFIFTANSDNFDRAIKDRTLHWLRFPSPHERKKAADIRQATIREFTERGISPFDPAKITTKQWAYMAHHTRIGSRLIPATIKAAITANDNLRGFTPDKYTKLIAREMWKMSGNVNTDKKLRPPEKLVDIAPEIFNLEFKSGPALTDRIEKEKKKRKKERQLKRKKRIVSKVPSGVEFGKKIKSDFNKISKAKEAPPNGPPPKNRVGYIHSKEKGNGVKTLMQMVARITGNYYASIIRIEDMDEKNFMGSLGREFGAAIREQRPLLLIGFDKMVLNQGNVNQEHREKLLNLMRNYPNYCFVRGTQPIGTEPDPKNPDTIVAPEDFMNMLSFLVHMKPIQMEKDMKAQEFGRHATLALKEITGLNIKKPSGLAMGLRRRYLPETHTLGEIADKWATISASPKPPKTLDDLMPYFYNTQGYITDEELESAAIMVGIPVVGMALTTIFAPYAVLDMGLKLAGMTAAGITAHSVVRAIHPSPRKKNSFKLQTAKRFTRELDLEPVY